MMVVGILRLELFLNEGPHSLKEKRHVLKKLKDKIKAKFDVSIAEVGDLDLWQKAVLGVAAVSNEHSVAEGILQKIINAVEGEPAVEIVDAFTEFQHYS